MVLDDREDALDRVEVGTVGLVKDDQDIELAAELDDHWYMVHG